MDFIQTLDSIDKQWLLVLNNDYPDFWDGLMYGISNKFTWIPFYIALIFILIKYLKRKSFLIILALIICILLADQISSGLIKDMVHRLRPSRNPEIENMVCLLKGYRGGKYGFVSSHAANSFGLALLTSLFFKNRKYTISVLIWATLVSFSRIYLGVHYPGDVIGGALVGAGVAFLVYLLFTKIHLENVPSNTSALNLKLPLWVMAASFIALIPYSLWIY
ncbi:MAG TPA: phosphatase PAP2 family protein [Paludibacteraceae bacterium]|nr:phosphatase PAP2 family protein [Paludibacteraceae bacterium]HPT42964.1 phosphatase PAP2 family protein [Paludibacteraceae bacterium]